MAPVALDIAPVFRPWRAAGLTALLLDAETARAIRAAAAGRSSRPRPSAPAPEAARKPQLDQSSGRPRRVPPPIAGPGRAVPGTAPVPAEEPPFTPAWQRVWEQMQAEGTRPLAVWTYAELGLDLCGQASAERRSALREVIASLALPRGSHAFWPYCLPPENRPEPSMFLAGLKRLRPAMVLLLGEQAATDLASLGPLPAGNLGESLCAGFRFVRLPDLDAVSGLSRPAKERLIAFLRTSLS